jgi:Protein of unknown function (DUF4058)
MKSPFPGMDPYLERHWGDVHQSAITYIRDWLQPRLPGDLRARAQERVFIDVPDPLRGEYYPDVRVVERPGRSQVAGSTGVVRGPWKCSQHFLVGPRQPAGHERIGDPARRCQTPGHRHTAGRERTTCGRVEIGEAG